jgi:DNA-directed RNA polymerase subunit RPC12/RpoP
VLTRFLIAAGNAQIMVLPDPILGIPLRYSVLAVGAFELAVVLVCLFGWRVGLQIGWLTWLAVNYAVFWLGLVWQHCPPQATCIGCLADLLHLSRGLVGMLIVFSPHYLLAGSFTASGWLWLENRAAQARKRAVEFLKMPCPSCDGHVKFSIQNLGRKIACPHCRKEMTLREPEENLKMACVLCGGHVEFPAHAIGQKIPCPHCAKTITLLKPA